MLTMKFNIDYLQRFSNKKAGCYHFGKKGLSGETNGIVAAFCYSVGLYTDALRVGLYFVGVK